MIETSSLPLWITEDITWPILWGILLVAILGFSWFFTRHASCLIALAITLTAMGTLIFVEQRTITDREYLVNAVHEMTKAVRANDVEGIIKFVHADNQQLKNRIHGEVHNLRVESCNLIGFNRKDLSLGNPSPNAQIGFAVWGTGTKGGSHPFSANVVVELDFEKKGGRWGMIGYRYRPSNSSNWFGGSDP